MPKTNGTETFTEMRNRLMEVHEWDRRIATIAARFYLGVESCGDLRARTQHQPIAPGHEQSPDITYGTAREIVMLR